MRRLEAPNKRREGRMKLYPLVECLRKTML